MLTEFSQLLWAAYKVDSCLLEATHSHVLTFSLAIRSSIMVVGTTRATAANTALGLLTHVRRTLFVIHLERAEGGS